MKKLCQFLILLLVLQACKKSSTNVTSPEKIKIEIVSGNNQWDTIGHFLKDSLVIRVTIGNRPFANAYVKIDQEDCPSFYSVTDIVDNNGLLKYPLQLTAKTGDQAIKLTALDVSGLPADSVTAHIEGRFFSNAWQQIYCMPHSSVISVCQSGTGRMFLGLITPDYPFYSDDNGISWQRLTSFPVSNLAIWQVVAKGNDVYMATRNNGVYYSSNNGASWENRSSGITDMQEVYKLGLTKSGKLFFSSFGNHLFMSSNKGQSWTALTSTALFSEHFRNFCETSTGILYMISADEGLYKSLDGGNTWGRVGLSVSYNIQSIFVDDNDDLFVGTFGSAALIYKSSDAVNWTLKYSSPVIPGVYMVVSSFYKVNGKYYFAIGGYGTLTTSDFSTYRFLTNKCNTEYLVAANNAVVIPAGDLWYNQNP